MNGARSASMSPRERSVLGLTSAAHAMVHLFEGLIPGLLPLLAAAFAADYFTLGLIVSLFTWAFGLGSLPAGMLVSRIGPRRLVTLFLFGAGAASLAVAVLASGRYSFGFLALVLGGFCSLYHPAANTLISRGLRRRGAGFGLHGISGSLGAAFSFAAAAWLGAIFGWRSAYVVFAVPALAAGVFSLRVSEREDSPRDDERETGGGAGGRGLLAVFAVYLAGAALLGMSYRGVMTFLPTFLGEKLAGPLGLPRVGLGGTVATAALVFGALGQYAGGRLSDGRGAVPLYAGSQLLCALCLAGMLAASGTVRGAGGAFLVAAGAAGFAFFYFATQPIQNVVIARILPGKHHGTAYGVHYFTVFGIGSVSAALSGAIADGYGLSRVFAFMAGLLALAFAVNLVLVFMPALRERRY